MQLENEFSVRRINLETFDYPQVEVVTWSSLASAGGSVDIEAKTPEGSRLTLYSEKIEENRNVSAEREYAQELADEWNANPKANWQEEILRCLKYCAKHEQRQIDEMQEHKDSLKKYKAQIKRLEAELVTA